jgi:hypothetical protein
MGFLSSIKKKVAKVAKVATAPITVPLKATARVVPQLKAITNPLIKITEKVAILPVTAPISVVQKAAPTVKILAPSIIATTNVVKMVRDPKGAFGDIKSAATADIKQAARVAPAFLAGGYVGLAGAIVADSAKRLADANKKPGADQSQTAETAANMIDVAGIFEDAGTIENQPDSGNAGSVAAATVPEKGLIDEIADFFNNLFGG